MRRRDVLKAAGGTGILTSIAATSGSARRGHRPSTDVEYRGTRVFEYEPERSGFAYVEKFRSKKLRSPVGRTVVTSPTVASSPNHTRTPRITARS